LCRMPVVHLPDDLKEELENISGTINSTDGPGVAVYWKTDRSARADIYVGLILDGLKLYQNISSIKPDTKMQFLAPPVLFCQSDDLHFYPDKESVINIKVSTHKLCICWEDLGELIVKIYSVNVIKTLYRPNDGVCLEEYRNLCSN